MIVDTPKSVSRSALSFLSGTLLSRLSGLGRDMSMAFCFGSHPAVSAFMVAFRLANLLRRLLGEGPLAAGFIPYFEKKRKESLEAGATFFRDLLGSLIVFLIPLILCVEIALYLLIRFGGFSPGTEEILFLTLLMFPGLLFISLFGIGSGLLQCEKKFFLVGLAPVAFNLVWIGTVFCFRGKGATLAMQDLSWAVIVGFGMQWMMIVPELISFFKRALPPRSVFKHIALFSQEIKGVIRPLLLSMVGVGAVQINTALDAIFARFASLEGPAYLWYAIRLEQLPLSLFGIALSSALLPPLSRMIQEGNREGYFRLLRFATGRVLGLMLPCTLGIFILGALAINLIYGRGDFTQEATKETYFCLCGYGVGLLPSVLVLLLAPSFYARGDYKTPMLGCVYAVLVNALLSAGFVLGMGWGPASIAYATSLSSFVNYFFLASHLKKEGGALLDLSLQKESGKTFVCTLIASLVTFLAGAFFLQDPTLSLWRGEGAWLFPRDVMTQLMSFVTLSLLFCVILLGYSWMTRAQQILECIGVRVKEKTASLD